MRPRYFTHIYNRGVDKRLIFLSDKHRERFLLTLRLSRLVNAPSIAILDKKLEKGEITPDQIDQAEVVFGPSIIDIIGFCQMDNHFHLITGEDDDSRKALAKFMHRLGTAFTMYFNKVTGRTGALFGSGYRHVDIESQQQLVDSLRYTHVNPSGGNPKKWNVDSLPHYPWSSLPVYLGKTTFPWINTDPVMKSFKDRDEFWEYTKGAICQPLSTILKKGLRLE